MHPADLVLWSTYRTSSRDCGERVAQRLRQRSTDSQKCISCSVLLGAIICAKKRTPNLLLHLRSKVGRKTIRAFHAFSVLGRIFEKTGKWLVREHRERTPGDR